MLGSAILPSAVIEVSQGTCDLVQLHTHKCDYNPFATQSHKYTCDLLIWSNKNILLKVCDLYTVTNTIITF